MKKTSKVISARLSRERVEVIEEIAREERVDKSTVIERALEHYAKEWKVQKAVEMYRGGSVTLSKAAEVAGVSIWEMIDILGSRRALLQYDLEDLEDDLRLLGRG